MPQVNIIRWPSNQGWLILTGGVQPDLSVDDIEVQALLRARSGQSIAYIWAAGDADQADIHLSALEDLGAPVGYLVDILMEDDATIIQQLSEAGLIILGDGPDGMRLRNALPGAALDGIREALRRGGILLAIGAGASVLGTYLSSDPQGKAGLDWLEQAVIVPRIEHEQQHEYLRNILRTHPTAYGLGLGTGSALLLGPDGELETWGTTIKIMLGAQFTHGSTDR